MYGFYYAPLNAVQKKISNYTSCLTKQKKSKHRQIKQLHIMLNQSKRKRNRQ